VKSPPELVEREKLESRVILYREELRLAQTIFDDALTRARRLRDRHREGRCVGNHDMVCALEALDDADLAFRAIKEIAVELAKTIDELRGDGLRRIEREIMLVLDDLRRDVDETSASMKQ
jgi:hypothetical protein